MPTGPAPTTRTRGLSAMARLLHLEPEVAHHLAPARRLGGNDGGEFLGRIDRGLDPDLEQPLAELRRVLRGRDLAPDRVDDVARRARRRQQAVNGYDRRAVDGLANGRKVGKLRRAFGA